MSVIMSESLSPTLIKQRTYPGTFIALDKINQRHQARIEELKEEEFRLKKQLIFIMTNKLSATPNGRVLTGQLAIEQVKARDAAARRARLETETKPNAIKAQIKARKIEQRENERLEAKRKKAEQAAQGRGKA